MTKNRLDNKVFNLPQEVEQDLCIISDDINRWKQGLSFRQADPDACRISVDRNINMVICDVKLSDFVYWSSELYRRIINEYARKVDSKQLTLARAAFDVYVNFRMEECLFRFDQRLIEGIGDSPRADIKKPLTFAEKYGELRPETSISKRSLRRSGNDAPGEPETCRSAERIAERRREEERQRRRGMYSGDEQE